MERDRRLFGGLNMEALGIKEKGPPYTEKKRGVFEASHMAEGSDQNIGNGGLSDRRIFCGETGRRGNGRRRAEQNGSLGGE